MKERNEPLTARFFLLTARFFLLSDLVGEHRTGARRIESSELLPRRADRRIDIRSFVRGFDLSLRSSDDLGDRLAGTHAHLVDRQADLTKVLEQRTKVCGINSLFPRQFETQRFHSVHLLAVAADGGFLGRGQGARLGGIGKRQHEHMFDQLRRVGEYVVVLAFVLDPLAIRGLTTVRSLAARVVRFEAVAGEKHIGGLAMVPGEQKFPLRVRRACLSRFPAVLLINGNNAERRCVVIRRKCAGTVADEQDHGVALLDVIGELFEQGRGTLAEMLLVADFQLFASQHPRDLAAIGFQLAADGGDEQPKFSVCSH
ncbi:MAG: hypothetical protein ABSD08_10900 [Xanthobacteraceae bacterium]